MIDLFNSACTFPIEFFPGDSIPPAKLGFEDNKLGYRGDDFDLRHPINVLFLGDSWTVGMGVPEDQTFARTTCRLLSERYGVPVANWNLGHGAKGYQYIARALMNALPVLSPDIVFITFPVMDRREYFTIDGDCIDIGVGHIAGLMRGDFSPTPIEKDVYSRWQGLISPPDDAAMAIMMFKLIQLLLDSKGINWGFSTVDWQPSPDRVEELIKFGHFDGRRYLGSIFEKLGQVSETDGHPDADSHQIFGRQVSDWLVGRYDDDLKRASVATR